ncbi:recombinase family protein [Candidatus Omnitrophota bacterium]
MRVSTDIQREKGESMANQKSRLIDYAEERHRSCRVYEDSGFSAKDTNRPALKRLINDVKNGKVEMVLVTKVDRITRRIKDLIDLLELFEEHDVKFKSLTQPIDTSSAMGRGFLNMLGVFAEMERGMVSERVGEDMRHRAKKGKWNGGVVPYGYALKDKKLFIHEDEAEIIKSIYKKYSELESLRGVTQWLNDNGRRTRNGKSWAAASISRILTNPTYIGKIWYNKRVSSKTTGKLKRRPKEQWIVCDGQHKPIVNEKLFNKVQGILKRQSQEPRRKMSEYLLSGLVRCGKCGGSLSGFTQRKITPKGEKMYSYYKCHAHMSKGSSVCKGNSINKQMLENLAVEKIISLADSREFRVDARKALDEFNRRTKREIKPLRDEIRKLGSRNASIEHKKINLLECLEDKAIDKQIYKNRVQELISEYEQNKSRIFELESKLNDSGIDVISFNSVYETVKDFRASWKYMDALGRKDLLWSLTSKIVVKDKHINIDLFFLPSLFSNISSRTDRGSW